MSTKTKTTAAAAIAALALPSAALATDGDHGKRKGHDKGENHPSVKHRNDDRSREKSNNGKHKGWTHGRRSVVVFGTDVSGLTVTDGKLAGPITLDPIAANRKARTLLELTKDEIKGEDTVQVGTAGDEVVVKYSGLQSGEALKPTDVVKVFGRVKNGALDIKKIHVKRPGAETDES